MRYTDRDTGTQETKRAARLLVSTSDRTGDLADALGKSTLDEWYRRLSRKDHYLSKECQQLRHAYTGVTCLCLCLCRATASYWLLNEGPPLFFPHLLTCVGYKHLRSGEHFLPTLTNQSLKSANCDDECRAYIRMIDKQWTIDYNNGIRGGFDWPISWLKSRTAAASASTLHPPPVDAADPPSRPVAVLLCAVPVLCRHH